MKTRILIPTLLILVAGPLYPKPAAPDVVLYGLARNAFGFTYEADSNTEVILRDPQGKEVIRRPVGSIRAPGVNYILQVPMDLGYLIDQSIDIGRYRSDSFREAEPILLTISENGVELPIMEFTNQDLQASPAGTFLRVDLTTGTDEDGDGIPDEWESFITSEDYGDDKESIYDVSPDDDFDGDGSSNFAEYVALTLPNWADDRFRITHYEELPGGMVRIDFTTKPGKSYQVYTATGDMVWEAVPFFESDNPRLQIDYYQETLFTERSITAGPFPGGPDNGERFFRIGVR